MHPYVYCSIIYNSQIMEATQVSTDRWVDKDVYRYNGILLSHKKEWNLAIYDNMDGPWGHYAKWKKLEKDKYHIISTHT